MDLENITLFHRLAIRRKTNGPDDEARRWAGECAAYYAWRILVLRRTDHGDRHAPAWSLC